MIPAFSGKSTKGGTFSGIFEVILCQAGKFPHPFYSVLGTLRMDTIKPDGNSAFALVRHPHRVAQAAAPFQLRKWQGKSPIQAYIRKLPMKGAWVVVSSVGIGTCEKAMAWMPENGRKSRGSVLPPPSTAPC